MGNAEDNLPPAGSILLSKGKVAKSRAMGYHMGFPGDSDGKEFACNAGNRGSILGLGRSPGEGNGYSLHCSCGENPTDRAAW